MSHLITLDFETYYDKDYSLSKITTEAYIRDPRFEVIGVSVQVDDQQPEWFSGSAEETKEWLSAFPWDDSYMVCHHTAFDGAILKWHFGIEPKYYADTLSMARPIIPVTVGGSLAKLAKHFNIGEKGTEVVNALGKRRKDFSFNDLRNYGEYCKNDVAITRKLFDILRQEIPNKELYIIDIMLRMFIDPVLKLDTNKLEEHLLSVRSKKEALMDKLDSQIGRDALMSNQQFAGVLESLGVAPPMKTSLRTGKQTYAFGKTDPEFKKLLEHEDESVQAVVAARFGIKSTLEETRTQAFIGISERGTLPILLNYYGAHTGRASGGDKINLQNLPRGGALRQSITAPDGHRLIACDSSQIEARVVAWLAGETELVDGFRNNVDIYSNFASDVYGRPINRKRKEIVNGKEVYPDFTEGFVGKTCILGLGYGMGKDKFKDTLKIGQGGVSADIPIDEAERIVNLYRAKYPNIVALWKHGQQALTAMSKGHEYELGLPVQLKCVGNKIHLPNGLCIQYPELRKDADGFVYSARYGETRIYGGKLIENVVQALARIVVFDQMSKVDQWLRKKNSKHGLFKMVFTVHDELIVCAPEDAVGETEALMVETMSKPLAWCADLPIACEAAYGFTYGDCK